MELTQIQETPTGRTAVRVGSSDWFDSLRVRLRNLWHWRTAWAYRHLTKQMKRDAEYAYGWHCNIACPLMDEGMSHAEANKAADRLMRHLFGVSNVKDEPPEQMARLMRKHQT